ncbi:hypothetical protein EWU49_08935 [Enterococcus faecium]|nr:hypothetical protein EWU49_08935 [Enterococcus faecium]TAP93798.1 hypothetical protein EWU50_08875 [Enterococcus faecium]
MSLKVVFLDNKKLIISEKHLKSALNPITRNPANRLIPARRFKSCTFLISTIRGCEEAVLHQVIRTAKQK